MKPLFLGIEIGGTKLQLVSSTAPPIIEHRYRASVDPQLGAAGILAEIQYGLSTLTAQQPAAAVGIGFGGPLDWRSGQIACSHQIAGWDGFNLRNWFHQHCGASSLIDNDANVACLAEATYGAGKSLNPVFYVTLGSGVGGGLVCDGQIYHGSIPGESEIGHLRLNREGLVLEQSCSGWAVDQKIKTAIEKDPKSCLANHVKILGGPPAAALGPALKEADPTALSILQSTADDLALGLSHVIHLQHPETIILGGGLSLLGEPLQIAVETALPKYLMQIMLPPPRIQLAALNEDVVPIGALALAEQCHATAR